MILFNIQKYVKIILIALITISASVFADDVDLISDFRAQDKIGTEEQPHLFATVTVKKKRDLHIVVRDMESWTIIKNKTLRIKKSGKYNLKLKVDKLKPGKKYRLETYLTPRKKKWNDRLTEPEYHVFDVVDAPVYVKKTTFSDKDVVRSATWPKMITDNSENVLRVNFDITEERQLHIKLYNTASWKDELGELKSLETKPGSKSYPISDMVKNFPEGKYAWVVYLTAVGSEEPLVEKKLGKHFTIKKAE